MTEYPEHDKLRAVAELTQAAGEFVDWLRTRKLHLAQYVQLDDDGTMSNYLHPAVVDLPGLLADWQGIDQNALEAEKRAMVEWLQRMPMPDCPLREDDPDQVPCDDDRDWQYANYDRIGGAQISAVQGCLTHCSSQRQDAADFGTPHVIVVERITADATEAGK